MPDGEIEREIMSEGDMGRKRECQRVDRKS